ncbi:MAG: MFS transporter [Candidatus Latescibacteria bacterium]|nr:MFS transporter [bacterium]MBD3423210.1 MFS transporter [Candidatus Latescibacterota bacterium]
MNDKNIALFFSSTGWFLLLSTRLTVSTLLVNIEESFGIDHALAGIALTGMWLSYGIMQFPSGVWSDIRGRKTTIFFSLLTFGLAFLFLGLTTNFFLFFVFIIILGIGTGFFMTASISMLSDLFREDRGRAFGIQASSGSLTGIVPIVIPILAASFHWRSIFVGLALITIVIAFLFRRLASESTVLPPEVSFRDRFLDGVSVLKQRTTQLFFLINLILVFSWIGTTSFFPTYMIESKGLSHLQAGICFSLLSLGGIVIKPAVGILSDRHNKRGIMTILLFLTSAGLIALVIVESFPALCAAAMFISLGTSVFLVANSYLMHFWQVRGRGGKLGFYRSFTILIGSPISAIIGYLATKYGFDISFLILGVLLMAASIIMFISVLACSDPAGKSVCSERETTEQF